MGYTALNSCLKKCQRCRKYKSLHRFYPYSDKCKLCDIALIKKKDMAVKIKKPKKIIQPIIQEIKPKKIKKVEFCKTKPWRLLREKFILKNEKVCCCCKVEVSGHSLHVDHIKPKSKFPHLALDEDNLQILCKKCNFKKNAHHSEDYRVGKPKPIC